MLHERINEKVLHLVKKYGTNNPFQLAEMLGIEIIYQYMINPTALFIEHRRIPVIILSTEIPPEELPFICAHELAPAVLHRQSNIMYFLYSNSMMANPGRYELEANTFAVTLLLLDVPLEPGTTIYSIAKEKGIPLKIAERCVDYVC